MNIHFFPITNKRRRNKKEHEKQKKKKHFRFYSWFFLLHMAGGKFLPWFHLIDRSNWLLSLISIGHPINMNTKTHTQTHVSFTNQLNFILKKTKQRFHSTSLTRRWDFQLHSCITNDHDTSNAVKLNIDVFGNKMWSTNHRKQIAKRAKFWILSLDNVHGDWEFYSSKKLNIRVHDEYKI